ncbi:MAG: phosphoribosylformylglycinamidine cyclo-ligase [Veillonella sp.]|uniref:phosphoribosylformylglycinamidine cyclo-ligase n=1 Tax=Veillonella sp. TaxID=1926307 RepID=UPI0025F7293B|nr:phosphoribosylformylglycinamidine cyclo-ligase [Veillonella sp.]MBS4914298.1 phosphoribosylformylglycinamidine cyclo-ligase [Veillonella sp.]
MCSNKKGITYRDAGVDIDAGNKAVELMKDAVKRTYTEGVVGDIGGFGGLYSLAGFDMKEPMLVSGTDGVGTKLRLAIMMDKHDTIGQDCVAMSVNDILVQGAAPLFFLDYIAVGKLHPEQVATIVGGVARACEESGCALLGGETAEMAGFYEDGDYDVAGFAVGIVDKPRLLTGKNIADGDVLIGLPSSGVHSNGFSLVRKIVFDHKNMSLDDMIPEFGKTLGEELLTPTRLYPKAVLPLTRKGLVKGMVHVTGGGFYDNIPRVLPEGLSVRVNADAWPVLPVFKKLQEWGNVETKEMYRTFNMGIGMILVVAQDDVAAVKANLAKHNETFYEIGRVEAGQTDRVIMEGRDFVD